MQHSEKLSRRPVLEAMGITRGASSKTAVLSKIVQIALVQTGPLKKQTYRAIVWKTARIVRCSTGWVPNAVRRKTANKAAMAVYVLLFVLVGILRIAKSSSSSPFPLWRECAEAMHRESGRLYV